MFKGRIISRSNVNGKIHTFQKDFDDHDAYIEFINANPEYSPRGFLENFWSPWSLFDRSLMSGQGASLPSLPADTRHLPEGMNLDKYEKRRLEKRQNEAEIAEKRHSLERAKAYLTDYLEENSHDDEAREDLAKIEQELKELK